MVGKEWEKKKGERQRWKYLLFLAILLLLNIFNYADMETFLIQKYTNNIILIEYRRIEGTRDEISREVVLFQLSWSNITSQSVHLFPLFIWLTLRNPVHGPLLCKVKCKHTRGKQRIEMRGKEQKKESKGECLLLPIGLSMLHSPFLSAVEFVLKCWSEENF